MKHSDKKKYVKTLLKLFRKYYPHAHCELKYKNPLELIAAVILSAQCTDKRVNQVTPYLFKKYKSAKDYAESDEKELQKIIYPTGFYKNKAKNIRSCMNRIAEVYKGRVPDKMSDLTTLSGVGRKTANVVLGSAFQKASGVVVDTHMKRVCFRLNLTTEKTPEKIEKKLNELIPPSSWIFWSYAVVLHGRYVCKARKPLCEKCFLIEHCPQKGVKKKEVLFNRGLS